MDEVYGSLRLDECHEHVIIESGENPELNCSYSSSENVYFAQETSYYKREENRPCMIRWKSGKRVDPRLITVLETFREIYVKRHEFFKKVFPGAFDEFVDVFKKFGDMIRKNREKRSGTLERSLSLGSISTHSRGIGVSEEGSELMLEKFKVKEPNVIVSDGKGSQTSKDAAGSSNTK